MTPPQWHNKFQDEKLIDLSYMLNHINKLSGKHLIEVTKYKMHLNQHIKNIEFKREPNSYGDEVLDYNKIKNVINGFGRMVMYTAKTKKDGKLDVSERNLEYVYEGWF